MYLPKFRDLLISCKEETKQNKDYGLCTLLQKKDKHNKIKKKASRTRKH